MSRDLFMRRFPVSRETLERFDLYAETLIRWQAKINLISSTTLESLWTRHFLDSVQVFPALPANCRVILDVGSGAGFPGMALALLGIPEVHLVESDQRKCAFLREVARVTGVSVQIHPCRIESLAPFPVDVVTSRAMASVDVLLRLCRHFVGEKTHCLFLKGQNAQAELTAAQKSWTMSVTSHPSWTDSDATLLDLHKVNCHDPA